MSRKRSSIILFALSVVLIVHGHVSAQGGWRQWEIKLLDGTAVEASPLQMRSDGRFTRSMDPSEAGFERSKIDYFAVRANQLPPAPTGKYRQDLVVTLDGKRSFGRVTFKSLKFSEGTIVQNGKERSLEKVAYVKFSHPKISAQKKKD